MTTTPDDYGFGDGSQFPTSPGGVDPNNPVAPVAAELAPGEAELERSMREFERQHPGAQGGRP